MMKKQNGVTLIALVITIIVLLILAGVSIAMLTGDNGILTNATKAQENTDRENAIESIDVALQAIKTEVAAKAAENTSYSASGDIEHLVSAEVIGDTVTNEEDGYSIIKSGSVITITYVNTNTNVSVKGSIDVSGRAGGTITRADNS